MVRPRRRRGADPKCRGRQDCQALRRSRPMKRHIGRIAHGAAPVLKAAGGTNPIAGRPCHQAQIQMCHLWSRTMASWMGQTRRRAPEMAKPPC